MDGQRRALHEALRRRASRDLDEAVRESRDRIAAIIREEAPSDLFDTAPLLRVRRRIDLEYDRVYGRFPDDPDSIVLRIVALASRRAYVLAFRQAIADIGRHVSPAVMRRMRGEAIGNRDTRGKGG